MEFDGTYPIPADAPRVADFTARASKPGDARPPEVVKDGVPWTPPPVPTAADLSRPKKSPRPRPARAGGKR